MMQKDPAAFRDLTRTTLAVLFVVALIFFSLWVALPFFSATLWATTIVISTWPILIKLQSKLGGRRSLATLVMTLALLLVLVIPLCLATVAVVSNVDTIVDRVNTLKTLQLPPPPDWLARIPLQGPKLHDQWQQIAAEGHGGLSARIAPYAGKLLRWFAARAGGAAQMVLQFLLTVIISAILYVNGETAARGVRKFAERLGGVYGDRAACLAAATIRGVALGVIVTAIVQTVIAVAGILIASVPGAGLLAAIVLMFCIAQLGPLLPMLPVVVWKFYSGDSVGGFVLVAFTLVAQTIDSFLRPVLIKRGADLPLILIFAGVIGGLISFGVMGIFVGPVVLAVTYVLLREWVEHKPDAEQEPRSFRSMHQD